jgi:hypothetical protein
LFSLWVKRRRFWYSESSVAADNPDNLFSAAGLADKLLLTFAYAAGDFGYAVGKAENSLFDKTCSSLIVVSYVTGANTLLDLRTFAIPTPMSWLPRMTAPVNGS